VSLELFAAGDRHLMRVSDSGPGLPEDIRGEAFERFVRADRDRGVKGHGLGLALVRAIAARHGARLVLPERPDGFTLEIQWPRLQQSG
jgi:signal transduction histidine kinase